MGQGTLGEVEPLNRQLLVAFSLSNRAMQARTREAGLLPGQPKVLEHLVGHEGCPQGDIARACVMDKSTVTSVLTRMERTGLVERRADPGDRRTILVRLTDEGRAAARTVLAYRAQVNERAWGGMPAGDRARLSELLGVVIRNLSEPEACEGNEGGEAS